MSNEPKVIWAYPSYVTGWDSAIAHNRPITDSVRYIRLDAPELVALIKAASAMADAAEHGLVTSTQVTDYDNALAKWEALQ